MGLGASDATDIIDLMTPACRERLRQYRSAAAARGLAKGIVNLSQRVEYMKTIKTSCPRSSKTPSCIPLARPRVVALQLCYSSA
eukprot:14181603-Alexandrium_andersonii.AAC.1